MNNETVILIKNINDAKKNNNDVVKIKKKDVYKQIIKKVMDNQIQGNQLALAWDNSQ